MFDKACAATSLDRRASVSRTHSRYAPPACPTGLMHPSRLITDHQLEWKSIYPGAFGLTGALWGLWCTNGSRKPISTRIIPERSAPPDAPAPWPSTGTMAPHRHHRLLAVVELPGNGPLFGRRTCSFCGWGVASESGRCSRLPAYKRDLDSSGCSRPRWRVARSQAEVAYRSPCPSPVPHSAGGR